MARSNLDSSVIAAALMLTRGDEKNSGTGSSADERQGLGDCVDGGQGLGCASAMRAFLIHRTQITTYKTTKRGRERVRESKESRAEVGRG